MREFRRISHSVDPDFVCTCTMGVLVPSLHTESADSLISVQNEV